MKNLFKYWYAWLFPVCALIICGILFARYLNNKGTEIVIEFPTAEGLAPGKTPIKFKGVTVGNLNDISISEDNKSILAMAEIMPKYAKYSTANTKYWLVKPEVSFQGVTGLTTLVEGTYINMEPSYEDVAAFKFTAIAPPELSIDDQKYSSFKLTTDDLGALGAGDPIFFKGVKVGQIAAARLSSEADRVIIDIQIENRHAKLVTQSSVFWRKQGVQADLGFTGAKVSIGSLESLMKGGINMKNLDAKSPAAKWGTSFKLQEEAPK